MSHYFTLLNPGVWMNLKRRYFPPQCGELRWLWCCGYRIKSHINVFGIFFLWKYNMSWIRTSTLRNMWRYVIPLLTLLTRWHPPHRRRHCGFLCHCHRLLYPPSTSEMEMESRASLGCVYTFRQRLNSKLCGHASQLFVVTELVVSGTLCTWLLSCICFPSNSCIFHWTNFM